MPTEQSPRLCILGSYAKALVVTAARIPLTGETLSGRDYRQTFGGKGSDMAVQAARLGAAVDYLGVVGNDHFGQEFIQLLEGEGISPARVRVSSTHTTGVGLIIKDHAGNNIIVVDDGANGTFSTEDLDAHAEVVANAAVVLAQLEIPLATALAGLTAASAAGAFTILNPAPAVEFPAGTDLSAVDVLTPNQGEARVLVGERPDSTIENAEVARRLQRLGVHAVVITMGEHGVDIFDGGHYEHVDPCPVDVVDSNGAGDSFNAALAVAICEGQPLAAAVRFANAAAALSCTGWETVPSYRGRADVDEFLASTTPVGAGHAR